MKIGPPLPTQHIIPSEYGVGQFVPRPTRAAIRRRRHCDACGSESDQL